MEMWCLGEVEAGVFVRKACSLKKITHGWVAVWDPQQQTQRSRRRCICRADQCFVATFNAWGVCILQDTLQYFV
jgi:hypothetical protein